MASEGWESFAVVFETKSSLRLHQSDTAIISYRVCHLERQIALGGAFLEEERKIEISCSLAEDFAIRPNPITRFRKTPGKKRILFGGYISLFFLRHGEIVCV